MARKDKYGFREAFPRFYKADPELKQKVGVGTLDPAVISKAQSYLDAVQTDVTPHLYEALFQIDTTLADAAQMVYGREQFLPKITKLIMDIKSNSGMFHELMVCRVSSFVLTFLDDVRNLDRGVFDIISAYVKVVKLLLDLKIKEDTNPQGQACLAEIKNAAKRYYDKRDAFINKALD
jgi:hypothetical protein